MAVAHTAHCPLEIFSVTVVPWALRITPGFPVRALAL
jgi:hypothetical protein